MIPFYRAQVAYRLAELRRAADKPVTVRRTVTVVFGVILCSGAIYVGIIGAIVGWPLTLPVVFFTFLLGGAALLDAAHPGRPRPFDWRRDGV